MSDLDFGRHHDGDTDSWDTDDGRTGVMYAISITSPPPVNGTGSAQVSVPAGGTTASVSLTSNNTGVVTVSPGSQAPSASGKCTFTLTGVSVGITNVTANFTDASSQPTHAAISTPVTIG